VLLTAAGLSLAVLDSLLFVQNRYHLSVVTFTLLDPQTFAFLGLYFFVGLAIEGMLAARIWERSVRAVRSRIGLYAALGLAGCFVASHLVFAWAEARYYMPVTAFTRYLPLYSRSMPGTPAQVGLLDRPRARAGRRRSLRRPPDGVLNYPGALACAAPLLNVSTS
jgi:membrane-anchored protein YejM (alkaline phosphatase superfamily)